MLHRWDTREGPGWRQGEISIWGPNRGHLPESSTGQGPAAWLETSNLDAAKETIHV